MNIARFVFSACLAVLVSASVAAAAENPPAINLAVLQAYNQGSNSIAGTTKFSKEGTARSNHEPRRDRAQRRGAHRANGR